MQIEQRGRMQVMMVADFNEQVRQSKEVDAQNRPVHGSRDKALNTKLMSVKSTQESQQQREQGYGQQ